MTSDVINHFLRLDTENHSLSSFLFKKMPEATIDYALKYAQT